ncbi:hypothetical protein EUGRSUZ_L03093 [Eucalyptus grandis]|uniref:Uncharacterized protein n=1 Tax=Eucalyptus grandis TaxID=71139 RepID=A0AAD9T8J5_EUCGR|nr:hypothetical protein EUGRSUZ_L03093 [Eucalyptus grandis]
MRTDRSSLSSNPDKYEIDLRIKREIILYENIHHPESQQIPPSTREKPKQSEGLTPATLIGKQTGLSCWKEDQEWSKTKYEKHDIQNKRGAVNFSEYYLVQMFHIPMLQTMACTMQLRHKGEETILTSEPSFGCTSCHIICIDLSVSAGSFPPTKVTIARHSNN